MRICILETDTNADFSDDPQCNISVMFQSWLAPALTEATWSSITVHAGEELPAPEDFDGYLITGSRHGVYDDLEWMTPLAEFIRAAKAAEVPVAGVCFGHQIMAHAYGAEVQKSAEGWVVGTETYGAEAAFAMHQDQVQTVPPGAATVLSSPNCPIARIEYGFPALSVQYHPEFTAKFMAELLDIFGSDVMTPAQVEAARASLDEPRHVDRIAQGFADFYRAHQRV